MALMMIPSPVTSTPFSVKDILNLEQQRHFHGAHLQAELEQHLHSAPCMLAAAEGTQFSDAGEEDEEEEGEKLSYLNSLTAAEGHGVSGLCPQSYVHTVLRDSCSGPKEQEEEVGSERSQSEYRGERNASVHLGHWLNAHKQPINLASMATRPFHIRLGSCLHQAHGQLCKAQVPEMGLGLGKKKKTKNEKVILRTTLPRSREREQSPKEGKR